MKFHVYKTPSEALVVPVYKTNLHVPYPDDMPAFVYVWDGAKLSSGPRASVAGTRVSFGSLPESVRIDILTRLGLTRVNWSLP